MIIDAHCHILPSEQGLDMARSYMAEAGIDHTILVPGGMIPLLGFADFLRGRTALATSAPDNDFVRSVFCKYAREFSGFFHVDPAYHMADDWDEALRQGFIGFKLNPLVNRVAFLSAEVRELCDYLAGRDLPLYTHVVLHGDASLDALELLLKEFPRLRLILGHMGFASTDLSAIQLASRLDNLYLETSVGSFVAIKEAVRRIGARRIIFGSEGPVHHVGAELRKIELLKLRTEDQEHICAGNILALTRLDDKLRMAA